MGKCLGVFDSGFGGLTVLKELAKKMDKTTPVKTPELRFFVSADPAGFDEKRRLFLPDTMRETAQTVDITAY